jgi:hypothetical protein
VGENAPWRELGKSLGTLFARRTSTTENSLDDHDLDDSGNNDNDSGPNDMPEEDF